MRTAVEIDPIAAESYRRIVGIDPIIDDIREVSGRRLLSTAFLPREGCFLLTACAPCQGFSSQRPPKDGAEDPRNLLIFEVVRLVDEIRPSYLMIENVPGLAVGIGEPIWRSAVTGLADLGYAPTDEQILDAADYGVPQRRERLIAVFRRDDMPGVSLPPPTHVDPHAGDKGGRSEWRTVQGAIGVIKPLAAGEADPDDLLHVAPAHSANILRRIRAIPLDGGSRANLPPELVLSCHHGHEGHRDVYGRMRWGSPAPTLTGGCNKPSKGRFIHPEQHRGITLREAALLQTFPLTADFSGTRDQIAGQIGNAVPPLLVATLTAPIKAAYDLLRQPTS